MYFQIVCEPSNQLESFIQFLIANMQKYARDLSIYDQKNVQIWNDYFSASKNFNKSPTVKDILIGFEKDYLKVAKESNINDILKTLKAKRNKDQ